MSEPLATCGVRAGEPVRHALDLLGDQWTLLILQSVFLHIRRYEELRRRLGISPTALSGRLNEAVAAGILTRVAYRDHNRTRLEYRLTEQGLPLWSLLVSIWAWEREWVAGRREQLPALTHLDCGVETAAPLGCGGCLRTVRLRDVDAAQGKPATIPMPSTSRRFRRRDADRLAGDPLLFFPATMELLGDRWSIALMVSSFFGAEHFSEYQRELGIGPSVLSDRLARLRRVGVLRTGTAGTRTDAHAYRLTEMGRAFFPALAFIVEFARTRCPSGEAGVFLRHRDCGHRLAPVLLCDHCGKPLERNAVRFEGGPDWSVRVPAVTSPPAK
ncbi:winged helix-turn-helix transcriptional regulator [Amycolatopsis nigrescens]|uniref:winged helix-turn-helix transcriptional regulator n=1 Tax=Amycolatopsis nigrescens TaxID=381445 RepID=UPI00036EE293|nr:winged helix-turn-helix transcriptional regulator [Amycolatopsis nigrescens]